MATPKQSSNNCDDSSIGSYENNSEDSDEMITIFFLVKHSKRIPLTVKKSETVEKVKRVIRDKGGISGYSLELYFSDVCLKDQFRLDHYGVKEKSILHVCVSDVEVIKLCISIGSKGKVIDLKAKVNETILSIKSKILASEGIQTDEFTLFFAGMALKDCETLSGLGIRGDSTLHLVVNPKDMVHLTAEVGGEKIVETDVKVLYTVGDAKTVVGSVIGYSLDGYDVTWEGKKLEDSKTLSFYEVKGEAVVDIKLPCIPIFVKLWSGKTISLYICPHQNVSCLMDMVSEKVDKSIDLEILQVKYGLNVLNKDRDLASYEIKRDSTLHMVLKPVFIRYTSLADLEDLGYSVPWKIKICCLKQIISLLLKLRVQDLVLSDKVLSDECCLSTCDVTNTTEFSVLYR